MVIIDSQVHAYEKDHPGRPWAAVLPGPPEVTGDDMVAAMDAVGVDAALLISPFAMYRYDGSYALEVRAAHPDRFALIKPVDPTDPAIADIIGEWAALEGTVGIRIMLSPGIPIDPEHPGIKRTLSAAAQHGMPVNLMVWGLLDQAAKFARENPDTMLIIDHLGLQQPFDPPAPSNPFADLPKVLALAEFENITVKITGACTLSHEPYPYNDIWDPLRRMFDGFGINRCIWGTDWTRAVNLITYAQGVEPFRLTDRLTEDERAELMGGTLQRVYNWSPPAK